MYRWIKFILCMLVDVGLKIFSCTITTHLSDLEVKVTYLEILWGFLSLYLLNMLMDQVDTLHNGRYWSEVL